MHDVVVVGSGPAGTAAALAFARRGLRACVVDVGYLAPSVQPRSSSWYDERRDGDTFSTLIGERFEGLHNITSPGDEMVPARLAAPHFSFVTKSVAGQATIDTQGFSPLQSFAMGGLANAWGAGLYRFNDTDLANTPLRASELEPYYDELTREIGITAADDDLAPYFGSSAGHLPPLRTSRNAAQFLSSYEKHRAKLNRSGFFVGRPRLGVLSEEYQGRAACDYSNHEFWYPGREYVYSPSYTLNKLVEGDLVDYRSGLLAERWEVTPPCIRVIARDIESGGEQTIEARCVVLAAGAINSAKIALRSRADYSTRLRLLDNPAIQVPLLNLRAFAGGLDERCFGLTQLNFIYERGDAQPLQGSVLEAIGPARATLIEHLPFSTRGNLALARHALPMLSVAQIFFPCESKEAAQLSLNRSQRLNISAETPVVDRSSLRALLKCLRRVSRIGSPVETPFGHGIHYAGTLPMVDTSPGLYETDHAGRLGGVGEVYAVDGAVIPSLPAKNFSFTIMANAMRIADGIAERLRANR